MNIKIIIDGQSYRQHAEEQGGTPGDVCARLHEDVQQCLKDADLMRLTKAMLAGFSTSETFEVYDAYADLEEAPHEADEYLQQQENITKDALAALKEAHAANSAQKKLAAMRIYQQCLQSARQLAWAWSCKSRGGRDDEIRA